MCGNMKENTTPTNGLQVDPYLNPSRLSSMIKCAVVRQPLSTNFELVTQVSGQCRWPTSLLPLQIPDPHVTMYLKAKHASESHPLQAQKEG
jgi:hypothetical protein